MSSILDVLSTALVAPFDVFELSGFPSATSSLAIFGFFGFFSFSTALVVGALGDSATSSFAPFLFLPLFAVAAGSASTSFNFSSLPAIAVFVFVFLLGLVAFGSAGLLDGSASAPSSKSKKSPARLRDGLGDATVASSMLRSGASCLSLGFDLAASFAVPSTTIGRSVKSHIFDVGSR